MYSRLKFSRYDRELGLFVIKFRDREETDTNLLNLMKVETMVECFTQRNIHVIEHSTIVSMKYEVVDAKENKNNIRDFGVETLKYRY